MKRFLAPIDVIHTGGIDINRDFKNRLDELPLKTFETAWNFKGGNTVKNIRDRSVICFSIKASGGIYSFYLKRHRLENLGLRRLLALFSPSRGRSQGRMEFDNICAFRKKGIPTVIPVAAGERFHGRFKAESFLITCDFAPLVSIESLFAEQPDFFKGPSGAERKKKLLRAIANMARTMHKSGLNHRDFNATHILVHYRKKSDAPLTALFDLQRVNRRKFFRFRWIIKSLADLNYTLPEDLFTPKERLYLFKAYKQKDRLNRWDRFQWRWITQKTEKVARHTKNILKKREKRRALGLPER